MLISATKRNRTVREESWDDVTKGKHTYIADVSSSKPLADLLVVARSKIGLWDYSIAINNCEHFVKWVLDLNVTSKQVKAGVGGAILGATLGGMVADNPKKLKQLGGAVLFAGLAIAAVRATEKKKVPITAVDSNKA